MSELKCCPFCGGEAEMLNYSPTEWLVHCIKCDGMVENWRKTKQEAIEQWNRRTPMDNIAENIVTSLESEKSVFLGTRIEQTDTILIDDAINIVKQEINNGN